MRIAPQANAYRISADHMQKSGMGRYYKKPRNRY